MHGENIIGFDESLDFSPSKILIQDKIMAVVIFILKKFFLILQNIKMNTENFSIYVIERPKLPEILIRFFKIILNQFTEQDFVKISYIFYSWLIGSKSKKTKSEIYVILCYLIVHITAPMNLEHVIIEI